MVLLLMVEFLMHTLAALGEVLSNQVSDDRWTAQVERPGKVLGGTIFVCVSTMLAHVFGPGLNQKSLQIVAW